MKEALFTRSLYSSPVSRPYPKKGCSCGQVSGLSSQVCNSPLKRKVWKFLNEISSRRRASQAVTEGTGQRGGGGDRGVAATIGEAARTEARRTIRNGAYLDAMEKKEVDDG